MAYTQYIHKTTTVHGMEVSYKLRRIKRKTMAQLAPFFADDEGEKVTMNLGDQMELMEAAANILPEYIVELNGLVNEDDEPMTFDDIKDEYCFSEFIMEIFTELMQSNSLTEDDVKK